MDTFKLIYGVELPEKPKVLVIGAGGIGCELLKCLALTGFKDIEVLDLDTIDVSNLNRQFLFTMSDVGKPKSEVAAKAISNRFPGIKVVGHVGNIKDSQFRSDFFSKFDIVFNALDNIDARKHVSRVCIALNKPLIDGGSTGFVGTTVSIVKNKTPCYECIEKPTPKQFPVCTIRSTPDKMIHCIVWAKLLLSALFGSSDDINFLEDIRQELATYVSQGDPDILAKTVFSKVFDSDIEVQVKLLEKKRSGPVEEVDEETTKIINKLMFKKLIRLDHQVYFDMKDKTEFINESGVRDDKVVWSIDWYAQLFFSSIKKIFDYHRDRFGKIEFDKDDEVLLDFVIAASNLRAHNYHINLESGFKIKEIAGNIIPAVSSTNGLVAGLEVIEGLKVLSGKIEDLRAVTYSSTTVKRLITGTNITEDINPKCIVCSEETLQTKLIIDPSTFKLEDLVNKIFFKELSISGATVEANDKLIYECGSDLDTDDEEIYTTRLGMLIKDLGITDKTTIFVDDFNQDFKCYIEIHYDSKVSEDDETYPNGYSFTKLNSVKNEEHETRVEPLGEAGYSTEVPIEGVEEAVVGDIDKKIKRKRKHSDLEEVSNGSKRSKNIDSSQSSEEYVQAFEID